MKVVWCVATKVMQCWCSAYVQQYHFWQLARAFSTSTTLCVKQDLVPLHCRISGSITLLICVYECLYVCAVSFARKSALINKVCTFTYYVQRSTACLSHWQNDMCIYICISLLSSKAFPPSSLRVWICADCVLIWKAHGGALPQQQSIVLRLSLAQPMIDAPNE